MGATLKKSGAEWVVEIPTLQKPLAHTRVSLR
jgi:hypothetical protein